MLVKIHGQSEKEKVFSEIQFLESKLVNLFNTMNNIESRNYKITTSELSKETTEKSSDSDNSSSQGGSSDQSSSSGGGGQSSGGESSSAEGSGSQSGGQGGASSSGGTGGQSSNEQKNDNKKFQLEANNILTSDKDINWGSMKSEIENLYTSLPNITLDLYQLNVNQEDVLAFNTEYDNLTKIIQNENKEETLQQLTKMYDYLPKFLRGSDQEELYTVLVETKANVLKGYAKLDTQNWQGISDDVQSAINSYSKLLTNTNINEQKQYTVSKVYVMLNELKNCIDTQDPSVFLIKYKNLTEEMNNLQ